MPIPTLKIFAISHYCEKARWALDYSKVEHRIELLAPGDHIKIARSLGLEDTSLPILVTDEITIQGSSKITDWVEAQKTEAAVCLNPDVDLEHCRQIEQRLDQRFGVHVRRYYYSEALTQQPQTVRPMFTDGLPWHQKMVLRFAWAQICKRMIRGMDLGVEQGLESRQVADTELTWIDEMLADGRQFLLGERFSRADLSVASLIAPLTLPAAHPTYNKLVIPVGVANDLASWQDRRSLQWAREIYQQYR
ncbi:MAG: glutathione S-transferase [Gammaproteobacteria bacterium]|nr:glutathione S-transferase [Gammaproteobacteria bacterium]